MVIVGMAFRVSVRFILSIEWMDTGGDVAKLKNFKKYYINHK